MRGCSRVPERRVRDGGGRWGREMEGVGEVGGRGGAREGGEKRESGNGEECACV